MLMYIRAAFHRDCARFYGAGCLLAARLGRGFLSLRVDSAILSGQFLNQDRPSGGYIPLILAVAVYGVMWVWLSRRLRHLDADARLHLIPVPEFMAGYCCTGISRGFPASAGILTLDRKGLRRLVMVWHVRLYNRCAARCSLFVLPVEYPVGAVGRVIHTGSRSRNVAP